MTRGKSAKVVFRRWKKLNFTKFDRSHQDQSCRRNRIISRKLEIIQVIFALFRGGLGGFFVTASSPLFGVSFFANSQFPQPPCEGGLGPRSQKTYTCSLKKKGKKVEGSKDGGRVVVLLTDDENVLCFHSSSFFGVKDSNFSYCSAILVQRWDLGARLEAA